jgi:hypothetical protein
VGVTFCLCIPYGFSVSSLQIGCGTRPASYPRGTGGLFLRGVKRHSVPKSGMMELNLRSPIRLHGSLTMALGSTQPLTEMSTRNLPRGKGRSARRDDNLTALCEPIA